MAFRNRIIERKQLDARELTKNPLNFRGHPDRQRSAVRGSLGELGWIDTVLVNVRSGEEWPEGERGVLTVINGHLRVELALENDDDPTVLADMVDLSPNEERAALAVLDESTGLAVRDLEMLGTLLDSFTVSNEELSAFFGDLAEDVKFLSEERQDVDKLAEEYGDLDDDELWPIIRIKVAPDTFEKFEALMDMAEGDTEAEKFRSILDAAEQV